jgi:predicted MFS family arabinose efflux permease
VFSIKRIIIQKISLIIIAGLLGLRNNKNESVSKIDTLGILLLVSMILSLLYGLKNIDFFNFSESIKSTSVYPFIITFSVLLPFFVLAEKRAEDPVMNLSYFTNPRIVITFLISFITGIVLMGTIFIPQFSENAMKISTGSGGYFVIILGLFAGVGAPISGKLSDKFGAKSVLLLGFTISLAGSAFLILVTTKYPGLITVIVSLMLIGLGMGFTIGAPLNYMMLEVLYKQGKRQLSSLIIFMIR